ncbi:MAG: decarboxylating NADP(+)-dependent phosphogluconate dehydrogenase [Verrucomicrobiota bacterium]|nr:decarboxylating NADP(+)-dependent phosphogluconate dehydrogenase [Verrucomicrobiota bacterium]
MSKNDFGLIGLAVMGQNLVLNVASRGFNVSVYNRTAETMKEFLGGPAKDTSIEGFEELKDFVSSLSRPRKIMLLVKSTAANDINDRDAVDKVIEQLVPLLEEGDLVIDGGNSYYIHSERRSKELLAQGLLFIGTGVSGGEEGALKGPAIMPGGPSESWEIIRPIFESIAAKVGDEPCVTLLGPGGAGHYVKMVHNGIEYGDMQLICEAYNIFKYVGFSPEELAEVFTDWNDGDLESYLIQITSKIFEQKDHESDQAIVDMILDRAGQKGTGRWTVMSAAENGVVISTINAAVEARILSSMKDQRVSASSQLSGPDLEALKDNLQSKEELVKKVKDALHASKIISYAQGLDLLKKVGENHSWNLNLGEIAKIWRGGCIIRAKFLNRITEAYDRNPNLENLMLDGYFNDILEKTQSNWREIVVMAINLGIPAPAFSASLGYYDSYRSETLPANLLQAQRDFFGAHTYERVDKPRGEYFHTDWPDVIED